MHIDGRGDTMLAKRFADQRANGQIRYVMVIHNVKMHYVSASLQHRIDLGAETREISR